ncbi:hypothetical protein LCM02_02310 [Lutimonas saemankumensis]|uniref:hypothetical protein n=1 Tax=Lutimonas saemankumensis TaxID=483016 RepID=UPI001CD50DDA|nr:hypothetical protein [Lutimonas saemankumensis]MCA0931267.1 hypothetical protein [Lutimonas saemankumensis]
MRTILLLFLILLSCTNRNGNNGYENILGPKNIETLDLIVADFEKSILKTNYLNENVSDSYLEFIADYSKSDSKEWVKIPIEIKQRFEKSQLESELYYHPDSVWILPNSSYDRVEEDGIMFLPHQTPYVKARLLDQINSTEKSQVYKYERYYPKINSMTDQDSIIKMISEVRYFNFRGKWYQAIREMENSVGFYKDYAAYKRTGDKQKFYDLIFKQGTLNSSMKRIIVLECLL